MCRHSGGRHAGSPSEAGRLVAFRAYPHRHRPDRLQRKTSTKDLTASVLSQGLRTIATQGNLNNHIGVPLSILRAAPSDEAAVWEMGMNHSGELAPLCEMTRPKIGIITSIGTSHMEYLGSRENIARENARWHTACRKTAS